MTPGRFFIFSHGLSFPNPAQRTSAIHKVLAFALLLVLENLPSVSTVGYFAAIVQNSYLGIF